MRNILKLTAFLVVSLLYSCTSTTIEATKEKEKTDTTSKVYYDPDIKAIIKNNCLSCHGGSSPSGGISLTNYKEVRDQTENGRLSKVINSTSNPMPPSGLMDASKRSKIATWIKAKYPEKGDGASSPSKPKEDPDPKPTPKVEYDSDIKAIIKNNCLSCHSGSSPSGGISLTNYKEVRKQAEEGNLKNRINSTSNPMPPKPKGLMDKEKRDKIAAWIKAGFPGKDDSPPVSTPKVKYDPDIKAIMTANCTGCHGGSSPSAGISLTTFTEVKNQTENGRLKELINSTSKPMPPNGLMSKEKRDKIAEWIKAKYPEK